MPPDQTTSAARVLVIEHEPGCPPALLEGWLAEAGCTLAVVRPGEGDAVPDPATLERYDALLVLGGSMDASDPAVPWLLPTRELIAEAAVAGVPTLGVCLGHQLLALALGGRVERNPAGQSVGLRELGWTGEATADPLLGRLAAAPGPGVFWNNDVVTVLPPGAVVLASGRHGVVQAARFAPTVWGVQWHPEADAGVLAGWAAGDAERHRGVGLDQRSMLADVEAARTHLTSAGRGLARAFSDLTTPARPA